MTETYRLGSLLTGQAAYLAMADADRRLGDPRALIRESDEEIVAYVSDVAGPATVGPFTAAEIWDRYRVRVRAEVARD